MNIEKEKTGDLTATIKIELEPADYQEKVDKQLKDYQRKANMPGFRPGHVPLSLVRKMYGKSLMYDTVNKTYSEALYKYLDDNKIEILGAPLANEGKNTPIDLENESNLTFWFDIALAPEFTVEVSDKIKIDHYKILVNEETIDKYLTEMRKRHGVHEDADIIEDNDMVSGEFAELDENGNLKEVGIRHDSFIYMEHIPAEEDKNKLMGLKAGDFTNLDPKKIARNEFEAGYFIGKKKEEMADINSMFRFTVKQISRNKIAELNEEFYNKVYPGENITSIEQMRERIGRDASESYTKECERKFVNDAIEVLRDSTQFELPEAFLKRYLLQTTTDKDLTKEKIEEDFEQHRNVIKWQLIENKIVRDNNLGITEEEIREFIKGYFRKTHDHDHDHEHGHEHDHEHDHEAEEKQLDQIADNILRNEEERKRISDKIFDDKFLDFLKNKISINFVDVTYDEFIKLISTPKQ